MDNPSFPTLTQYLDRWNMNIMVEAFLKCNLLNLCDWKLGPWPEERFLRLVKQWRNI